MVLALRLLLAGVFATAGVAKLRDIAGSRRALEDFGVPARLARSGGVLLPLAEIVIAAALVFPPSARWGALAAAALLALFVVAIGNAMAHGRAPDCHCFGQVHSEPAGWRTLARNGVLIAFAALVAASGPGPAVDAWIGDRSASELVAVAAGLGAGVLAAFLFRAWSRRREQARREESYLAEVEAAKHPPGKPVGSVAPTFALRGVHDEKVTLDSLRARGKPVVLVFVHPRCETCRELLPRLAEWQKTLAEQLTIAVLSEGSLSVNRAIREEHGIADFLLQRRSEVYEAYEARGTPSAVVVDSDGTIATTAPLGQLAIEELIRLTLGRSESWKPSLVA
jgi:uncharacterized membrane protein YphA (DoxX/SURF4 family)/peroxiredoxin